MRRRVGQANRVSGGPSFARRIGNENTPLLPAFPVCAGPPRDDATSSHPTSSPLTPLCARLPRARPPAVPQAA
jgi:hypothetical protein